jgi:OOP family OmpA-OmpF porin
VLNKKALVLGALGLSGGVSAVALADSAPSFYAGVGLGRNTLKDNSVDFDASDTAFKVFAGYNANKWLSIEATYIDGGSPSQTFFGVPIEAKVSGFDVSLVGDLALSEKFSLIGRLGTLFWDEKVSAPSLGISEKQTGHDISYGAGASLKFTPNAAARLEWQSANTDLDVSVITLSFAWKFSK